MDIELEANERIDDLEFKNLKIIQNKDGFCFGIDSVLLSDFAKTFYLFWGLFLMHHQGGIRVRTDN